MKTNKRTLYRTVYQWLVAAAMSSSIMAQTPAPPTAPAAADPSKPTGPWIDKTGADDFLKSLPKAYHPAYEGVEEIHTKPLPADGGKIPNGGIASPLFGAKEFGQQLLLLEEFGTKKMEGATEHQQTLPLPASPTGFPDGEAIDAFLSLDGFSHLPTKLSNTGNLNPWKPVAESFLGRTLEAPPAEGRPPGESWAHQRWEEFLPEVYFKTIQTGARLNSGFRDGDQRHGYQLGEFAPGGLYHTVYATDEQGVLISGTTNGIKVQFHPNFPVQDPKSLWTFDGNFPGKLLEGRYGEAILMRHYNGLPVDPTANHGFGLHTITTHEHNGHNPAESDGFTGAFYFPGQYWDYRWPMIHAGYDTVNTTASDPRAAFPADPGESLYVNDLNPGVRQEQDGRINLRGDWRETMSSHWFHDHMIDHTAENVYKGNAACFNMYSAVDRGNEAIDDGVNLRFPSGTALGWGNRDYDINLMVADKAWDADGQLFFNPFDRDGFLGDQILTNWVWKPYLNVRHRSYRLRFLNGGVARFLKFAIVKKVAGDGGEYPGPPGSGESYDRIGFYLIANDGNILEHAIPFDGSMDLDADGNADEHKGLLPNMGVGERYDIIVDFASQGIVPGDRLYVVNVTEHADGRGPKGTVPLADILSGRYAAQQSNGVWVSNDPAVGKFLEFRVVEYAGEDLSMNPADYVPGAAKMIPLPWDRNNLAGATRRTFEFGRSAGTDAAPWTVKTDGTLALNADPRRISSAVQMGTGPTGAGFDGTNEQGYDDTGAREIWTLKTGGGWDHPVHIHFEEALIISRDGNPPPVWEWWARKDLFRIGPSEDSSRELELAIRIREFAGTFVEHCHTTTHEDHAMLSRWDSEHPGQVKLLPSPIPSWDGVEFVDSVALPTFRSGVNGPELPDANPFLTPVIDTFTGTSAGGTTTLSWSINELSGDNVSDIELTPGIGSVHGRTSTEVRPTQTTIYRLTAKTPGGVSTATITVSPDGEVTPGAITNGAAPGADLLTNGGFEDGLNGWTFVNSNAGSTSVAMDEATGSMAALLEGSRIHRSLPVTPGVSYIFSATYRNTGSPAMKMGIEFYDAAGRAIDLSESSPTSSSGNTGISVRAKAPVGATRATIYFESTQPGATYVDNASFAVEEFVEPDAPVRYQIKFTGRFTAGDHPSRRFPKTPQFSPFVAVTHSDAERIWREGETASPGVVKLAETGLEKDLVESIDTQVGNGFGEYVVAPAVLDGDGQTTLEILASPETPVLSLIGMVSPSPDWFVGADSVQLLDENGRWKEAIELELYPHDAGSDSGPAFEARNLATIPRRPVASLQGVAPFSSKPIAVVSITRVNDGAVVRGANLLTNGGFEGGLTGWSTYATPNGRFELTSLSFNGLSGLELEGALVHQMVPVTAGLDYELVAAHLTEGTAGSLVGIEFLGSSGVSVGVQESILAPNPQTTRHEAAVVRATAPAGAVSAKVYFWSPEQTLSRVDDFEFHTIDAPDRGAGSSLNRLLNGGFEEQMAHWNVSTLSDRGSVALVTSGVANGIYSCSIDGGMVHQNLAVPGEAIFAFKGQYSLTTKVPGSGAGFGISLLDAAGNKVGANSANSAVTEVGISFFDATGNEIRAFSQELAASESYQAFSINGVAPDNAASAKVYALSESGRKLKIDALALDVNGEGAEVPVELFGPSVKLTTNAADASQPFTVNVLFSEAVAGLEAPQFALSQGTAQGLSKVSDFEYFLNVIPTGNAGVSVSLPAGSVANAQGRKNLPSNVLMVGDGAVPQPEPKPDFVPESLKGQTVPEPTNLSEFIRDRKAAIELGKALFWDTQVGSDGKVSCATCHYHAGADSRSKNQISPGLLRLSESKEPSPDRSFDFEGPNYVLKREDFPFHRFADMNDRNSEVISSSNDVVSSQGVFLKEAGNLFSPKRDENGKVAPDDVFHIGGVNTRRVEPRNAPTVINSVYNLRNFWDGRAQSTFNGVNLFGDRDPDAAVWKVGADKKITKVKVRIDNASLASQAVAPVLSHFEMSDSGRRFEELGRKLLLRRPLENQLVHREDGVLGKYSLMPRPGLAVPNYKSLVEKAFHPEWWSGKGLVVIDGAEPMNGAADVTGIPALDAAMQERIGRKPMKNGFSQMEANFSLFFGLAIQLYESTLVSDDTPFDRFVDGDASALTAEQQAGMNLFFGKANCAACHAGPEFTSASVGGLKNGHLERMVMGSRNQAVYDRGFYNIGVRPSLEDLGIGGSDPFGHPLSEARLAEQAGSEAFEGLIGVAPNLSVVPGERVAADGAFKTPTLRNIELTAPYFHNGGTLTLEEVVQFYNRGGDFHGQNIDNVSIEMDPLGLTDVEMKALVEFMKSLTDERVRNRRAPFDHPQLVIPNGHRGDVSDVSDSGDGSAIDDVVEIPATGAGGGSPLPNFLETVAPEAE